MDQAQEDAEHLGQRSRHVGSRSRSSLRHALAYRTLAGSDSLSTASEHGSERGSFKLMLSLEDNRLDLRIQNRILGQGQGFWVA